ncbi:amidase [Caldimonas caldifontis]|uniref:Amidase n=1 Tax=Caldimonas caldifontis TaxID=1452508 RepID=A0A2S5SVL6_9BURK|nr:amidase [Caldimonas caldifontis]PPE66805.1 amidase [Caldimonas caldifontis]
MKSDTPTVLHELSATELLAQYARGTLSPVEVTRAVIAHIERWEPHLKATYAFDPEGALAMARASEARWRRGEALALDGVPVMIKENIATRGVPTPLGTAATELVPAEEDSPPAARLREAGAVFLGKTTMPDYGMLSSGLSSFHPLTRNPWDLRKNPGGSSAGAGAGVAAGYGPLHLGTDIGGSVRLPASWCGIVTLKPSLGRIPIDPPYPARVAGPMTRTVADAALMMGPLSRPDARDHMSLPWQDIAWHDLDCDVKGLRIGLHLDAGWGTPVACEVREAVLAAARAFEAAGAVVEPLAPWCDRSMIEGVDRFWRTRFWIELRKISVERRERILPFIRAWAEGGAGWSGEDLFEAYSQTLAIRKATVDATQPYDYVLSPTAPMVAFDAELPCPTNDVTRPFDHIAFTLAYNMSEQPAASINAGYTAEGLPIGLQIAGRRFDDLGVLQMARAWERLRPAQRPWPMPPA